MKQWVAIALVFFWLAAATAIEENPAQSPPQVVLIDPPSNTATLPNGSVVPISSLPKTIEPIPLAGTDGSWGGYLIEFSGDPIANNQSKNQALSKAQLAQYKAQLKRDREQYFKEIDRVVPGASKKKGREFDTLFHGALVELSESDSKKLQKAKLSFIKKIHSNLEVKALLNESVPQIQVDAVWQNLGATGSGVRIAIIDTGVDYMQPELGSCLGTGCKVVGGYDFINNDADPMDDQSHGTHVAATAAGKAVAGNSNTLNGVAPDATIYAYKVLNSGGSGTWAQVIAGMERAVDPNNDGDTSDHVDVMSMSLGGYGNPDDAISQTADRAVDSGVVVVIAAGNSGPSENTIGSPGTSRKAITVAAVDKNGLIAGFNSRGPVQWTDANGIQQTLDKPDISAPGVNICAAQWDSAFSGAPCNPARPGHVAISGTSMATPHVAGVAALLKQLSPSLPPVLVKQAIMGTATNLGYANYTQGAGLVNALAAVQLAKGGALGTPISVSDNPTQRFVVVQGQGQYFNHTGADQTLALSVENSNPQALTVAVDTPTVVVPANGNAPYSLTFTIDNDAAVASTQIQGKVIAITGDGNRVESRYSVYVGRALIIQYNTSASTQNIFFGFDNPNDSVWVSAPIDFNITNVRTDASKTVSISADATIRCPASDWDPVCGNIYATRGVGVYPNVAALQLVENGVPLGGSTIMLGPGENKAVQARLSVNNATVPNKAYWKRIAFRPYRLGAYGGVIMIGIQGLGDQNVAFSLSKCHAVQFHWSETPRAAWVMDKNDGEMYASWNDLREYYPMVGDGSFCIENPGFYDIGTIFAGRIYETTDRPNTFVVRENVNLNGFAELNVDQNEAIHTIDFVNKDLNGNVLETTWHYMFVHQDTSFNPWEAASYFFDYQTGPIQLRFNTVSENYRLYYNAHAQQDDHLAVFGQGKQYLFQYYLNGINASHRFENNPTDFKSVPVTIDPPFSFNPFTESMRPLVSVFSMGQGFAGYGTFWSWYSNAFPLYVIPLPENFEPIARQYFQRMGFSMELIKDDVNSFYSFYNFGHTPTMHIQENAIVRTGPASPYATERGNGVIYPTQSNGDEWNAGKMPLFWNATTFFGGAPRVSVLPYYNSRNGEWIGSGSSGLYFTKFGLFRTQGFDVTGHGISGIGGTRYVPIQYELLNDGGAIIANGTWQDGGEYWNFEGENELIPLPTAGKYRLQLTRDYNVTQNAQLVGPTYQAKVGLDFDNRKVDPHPPTFSALEFLINGKNRDQVNGKIGPNQLRFSLDPVGGSIQSVSLEVSSQSQGMGWKSVPLNRNGLSWQAEIPKIGSASIAPADFRITAADDSSNQLQYEFQLPIMNGPYSGIANSGNSTVRGWVRAVIEEQQSDSSWLTVQTVVEQEQTILPNQSINIAPLFNQQTVFLPRSGSYRVRLGVYSRSFQEDPTTGEIVSSYSPLRSTNGLMESIQSFSNELLPPELSNVQSGSITSNSASVSWQTNIPTNGTIEYGTTTAYGQTETEPVIGLTRTHSVLLHDLPSNATIHYRVVSCNGDNDCVTSNDSSFVTASRPTISLPPTISNIQVSDVGETSAVVSWETNPSASSQVDYGTTTQYGQTLSDATLSTTHSIPLTGLQSGKTYHYQITSCNSSNQCTTSPDQNFATAAIPPTISNIQSLPRDYNALISWNTNEDANSLLEYGTTTSHGMTRADPSFISPNHGFTILNLTQATIYHYKITACDSYGNCSSTTDQTFTTTDSVAPTIIPISVISAAYQATITYNTSEPADTNIEYGIPSSGTFSKIDYDAAMVGVHERTITGLNPNTAYSFRMAARDAHGNNSGYSATQSFTTQPALTITNNNATNLGKTSATAVWATNLNANERIDYGTTASMGTIQQNLNNYVTSHAITLNNLSERTKYYFTITSCATAENCSTSLQQTFTTK